MTRLCYGCWSGSLADFWIGLGSSADIHSDIALAVFCSVLQWIAVCCSDLQCVAVCCAEFCCVADIWMRSEALSRIFIRIMQRLFCGYIAVHMDLLYIYKCIVYIHIHIIYIYVYLYRYWSGSFADILWIIRILIRLCCRYCGDILQTLKEQALSRIFISQISLSKILIRLFERHTGLCCRNLQGSFEVVDMQI